MGLPHMPAYKSWDKTCLHDCVDPTVSTVAHACVHMIQTIKMDKKVEIIQLLPTAWVLGEQQGK